MNQKVQRGGSRKGIPNLAVTTENSTPQTRAALKKHSPLDVMVLTMNGYIAAAEILGNQIVKVNDRIITKLQLLREASSIAKDAAPYCHARLANIEVSGPEGGPIPHHVIFEVRAVGASGNGNGKGKA